MKEFKKEWTTMIVAIDNFVEMVNDQQTESTLGIDEDILMDLQYDLESLQGSANEINDTYNFKTY